MFLAVFLNFSLTKKIFPYKIKLEKIAFNCKGVVILYVINFIQTNIYKECDIK